MADPQLWVIWSEEHGGWWRPGALGYTSNLKHAARYKEHEAVNIERDANRHLPADVFHEVAMRDPQPSMIRRRSK